MTKDLYLATYYIGSMEEVPTLLHMVCGCLLALRREYGIALFGRVLLCPHFSVPLSGASALAIE